MTKIKTLKQYINEAKSILNVGDRVHIGTTPTSTDHGHGTVHKTNGFGHVFVKGDNGQEYKFDKSGLIKDHPTLKYLRIRHPDVHTNAMAELNNRNDEFAARRDAKDKVKKALIELHDPVHKEIINKLKHHSGDPHLANLGEPEHIFYGDQHGDGPEDISHLRSDTESPIKEHGFPDLFDNISKHVKIYNSNLPLESDGITHSGSIEYRYNHPGGGSNGFGETRFERHKNGEIRISKPVEGVGDYGKPTWNHKVVKVIK